MRSKRLGLPALLKAALIALLPALTDSPARAHHSFAAFDMEVERTIEGEIVEFDWTEPHTLTRVEARSTDGTTTRWDLEGMSPSYLGRRGWTRDTLRPGDRVAIVIHPLKSGEPGGTFLRVTLEDGTQKVMLGGR